MLLIREYAHTPADLILSSTVVEWPELDTESFLIPRWAHSSTTSMSLPFIEKIPAQWTRTLGMRRFDMGTFVMERFDLGTFDLRAAEQDGTLGELISYFLVILSVFEVF